MKTQPMRLSRGGCWSIDEKMGQININYETASTLVARDYKQPQAVIYEIYKDETKDTDRETVL